VESGNGRLAAQQLVFGDPAQTEVRDTCRAFLAAQGHGVAGLRAPVLVSRRVSALSPEDRRAFVAETDAGALVPGCRRHGPFGGSGGRWGGW
jgi:hypothetical protein